jgi:hypothetical protein
MRADGAARTWTRPRRTTSVSYTVTENHCSPVPTFFPCVRLHLWKQSVAVWRVQRLSVIPATTTTEVFFLGVASYDEGLLFQEAHIHYKGTLAQSQYFWSANGLVLNLERRMC